ncbi:hypothetical protein P7K49_031173 [Saguinus oedipus]|uniref:Uncharacterized protein n=1 Tax=Saguinus oedipus TaxID=9490 RepID=A0ABQ9U4A3_SAGOE|nr:hypothetical protein P7K49_031173 [Saguinus oedipus]
MVFPISAIFSEDKNTTEPVHKVKNIPSIFNTPEPTPTQEPLVGSQKRKARKTKITHLVRTADGRVSPAGATLDDKPKEQLQRNLPKATETDCSDECSHNTEVAETRSSTPEMPAVSAFFSLAALAEVAAMENVHRKASVMSENHEESRLTLPLGARTSVAVHMHSEEETILKGQPNENIADTSHIFSTVLCTTDHYRLQNSEGQRSTPLTHDGQPKEMPQAPVLISCADQ